MRVLRSLVLAAVASLIAGIAAAQTANVMTVRLPGGGLAEIRYFGDVPPQVAFLPSTAGYDGSMPAPLVFGRESPFAVFERISAEMDRRAAEMFRYAAAALADQTRDGQTYTYASAMPAACHVEPIPRRVRASGRDVSHKDADSQPAGRRNRSEVTVRWFSRAASASPRHIASMA